MFAAQLEEAASSKPNAETALAKAVTSRDQWAAIFDKLKSKQGIWISFSGPMGSSKKYLPFTVGRRSHSKKYNVSSLTIRPHGTKTVSAQYARLSKFTLYKRDGDVSLALGDMAASLKGIYVP